jgi:hypothetical protein
VTGCSNELFACLHPVIPPKLPSETMRQSMLPTSPGLPPGKRLPWEAPLVERRVPVMVQASFPGSITLRPGTRNLIAGLLDTLKPMEVNNTQQVREALMNTPRCPAPEPYAKP